MTAACPACGKAAFIERSAIAGELITLQCSSCGLVIGDHLGGNTGGYELVDEGAYNRSIGRMRREQARTAVAVVARLIPSPRGRWVDIGCGVGILLAESGRAGFNVLGLEPDPIACEQARSVLGEAAVRQEVFGDASVSPHDAQVISTMDVLEHVPVGELGAFAALVRSRLVPGGLWVIKVPTTEGLYYRGASIASRFSKSLATSALRRLWLTQYEYPHTVYFAHQSMRLFLRRHGFDVVHRSYLPEVKVTTVMDRLRVDRTISPRQAVVMAPGLAAVAIADRLRRKTDAMLVIAQRADEPQSRGSESSAV